MINSYNTKRNMQIPGWSTVQGHTAGFITPNTSWFKRLPSGRYVEFWYQPECSAFTVTLVQPKSGFKPGQLYVQGEILQHLSNATLPAVLAFASTAV